MKAILAANKAAFNSVLIARQQQATQVHHEQAKLEIQNLDRQRETAQALQHKLAHDKLIAQQQLDREQEKTRLQLKLEYEKLSAQKDQDTIRDQLKIEKERLTQQTEDVVKGRKELAEVSLLLSTEHNKLRESNEVVQKTLEQDRETLRKMLEITELQKLKLEADIEIYTKELTLIYLEKNDLHTQRQQLTSDFESFQRQNAILQAQILALESEKETLAKEKEAILFNKNQIKIAHESLINEQTTLESLKYQIFTDKETLRLLELNIIHGKIRLSAEPQTREIEVTSIIEVGRQGKNPLNADVIDSEFVNVIGDID